VSESTGPGRRWWWWLAAVAGAGLAVAAGVVALSADRKTAPPNPCDVAGKIGESRSVTGPPAGKGLRIVEKGFTRFGRPVGTVSLGAIVENTSDLVAYRTRIRFRVFDDRHHSAVAASSEKVLYLEIPVILPGHRIGVGDWAYLREGRSARTVPVSGFEIELGTPQWWPTRNTVFRPVTTRHLRTERNSVEHASGTVGYSVDSALCRPFATRGVATVFRNSAGAIVGGSFARDNSKDRCIPGKHTESVEAFGSVPPGIDDSRTESYPYCDPAPVGDDYAQPGQPAN
jgi:hypothetical protein